MYSHVHEEIGGQVDGRPHEIRVRLGGISRQRVYQITRRRDFPAPVADLAAGKVWLADDVTAWLAVHRPNLTGTTR